MQYRYVVEDEVLEFIIQLSGRNRERLLSVFQAIADTAPLPAPEDHRDATGRQILCRDLRDWRVWFWYDGPVHEVRIVDVEPRKKGR